MFMSNRLTDRLVRYRPITHQSHLHPLGRSLLCLHLWSFRKPQALPLLRHLPLQFKHSQKHRPAQRLPRSENVKLHPKLPLLHLPPLPLHPPHHQRNNRLPKQVERNGANACQMLELDRWTIQQTQQLRLQWHMHTSSNPRSGRWLDCSSFSVRQCRVLLVGRTYLPRQRVVRRVCRFLFPSLDQVCRVTRR